MRVKFRERGQGDDTVEGNRSGKGDLVGGRVRRFWWEREPYGQEA